MKQCAYSPCAMLQEPALLQIGDEIDGGGGGGG